MAGWHERSPKLGAVSSLSSPFFLQEHRGPMKRTKSCLSQLRYWHLSFLFVCLFVWKPIAWQRKRGFNLPLLKYDECYYAQGRMKTSVILLSKYRSRKVQFITSLISSVRSRKYATLSIFPPSHMQLIPGCNLLMVSPFLQWSVILSHPRLTAPPLISRAELFCNICWCGSASKCCRIVLLLELFFSADRRGEEPPPLNVIGCRLQNVIIIYTWSTCVGTKKGTELPLNAGGTGIFNILLRKCYFHIY